MPWIARCSLSDIEIGNHRDPNNCILIQIVDHDMEFPEPRFKTRFGEIYQYKFLDIDEGSYVITPEQALSIASTLKFGIIYNANILVHCVMGVSRSGGVCEAAESIGFEYLHDGFLCPNLTVKRMIIKELYDEVIED